MGPAWFRRILLDLIPIKSIQRVKTVNDIVFDHAKRIIDEKKAALERGDQELLHMVGEGKDIISIVCEYAHGLSAFQCSCKIRQYVQTYRPRRRIGSRTMSFLPRSG